MKSLAELLPKVYPAPEELDTARLFARWVDALPPRVVAHARPVKLARGTLHVNVTSTAWANELSFLERDLVAKLRIAAPSAGVQRIRFRVGPLPDLPERHRPTTKKRVALPLADLPPELARVLAHVRDDDLRSSILAAAAAGLGEDRESD